MMKNTTIIKPQKMLGQTFIRYSLVLSIIFITSGLMIAILILNDILTTPSITTPVSVSTDTSQATSNSTMFDQTIINRLSNLERSTNNSSYQTLPAGRISPFSE